MARYDKSKRPDPLNDENVRSTSPQAKAIFADKMSFISFLEGQLDKVSNALYITNGIKDKYDQLTRTVEEMDSKFLNTTKVLKLLQSFVDTQEDENMQVKERLRQLSSKLDACADATLIEPSARVKKLEARLEQRLADIDNVASRGRSRGEEDDIMEMLQEKLEKTLRKRDSEWQEHVLAVERRFEVRQKELEGWVEARVRDARRENEIELKNAESRLAEASALKKDTKRDSTGRRPEIDFEEVIRACREEIGKSNISMRDELAERDEALRKLQGQIKEISSRFSAIGEIDGASKKRLDSTQMAELSRLSVDVSEVKILTKEAVAKIRLLENFRRETLQQLDDMSKRIDKRSTSNDRHRIPTAKKDTSAEKSKNETIGSLDISPIKGRLGGALGVEPKYSPALKSGDLIGISSQKGFASAGGQPMETGPLIRDVLPSEKLASPFSNYLYGDTITGDTASKDRLRGEALPSMKNRSIRGDSMNGGNRTAQFKGGDESSDLEDEIRRVEQRIANSFLRDGKSSARTQEDTKKELKFKKSIQKRQHTDDGKRKARDRSRSAKSRNGSLSSTSRSPSVQSISHKKKPHSQLQLKSKLSTSTKSHLKPLASKKKSTTLKSTQTSKSQSGSHILKETTSKSHNRPNPLNPEIYERNLLYDYNFKNDRKGLSKEKSHSKFDEGSENRKSRPRKKSLLGE